MKKAILFTVGLFFLTTTVFSLAIVVFHISLKSEDVFLRFASLDRVYELDVSLQNSIKNIFNTNSGVIISQTSSTISFQDYLPNPNKDQLFSALNNFESYVESIDSNIDLDINKIKNMSLIIRPYNITYNHFFDNITYIIPSAESNITSYAVYLDTGDVNVTDLTSSTFSDGLNFEVVAEDNQGNNYQYSQSIDGTAINTLTVSTKKGDIDIKIWDTSKLLVNNTADLNLSITIQVSFTELKNEEPGVILSGNIININLDDFGIRKNSGVRLI